MDTSQTETERGAVAALYAFLVAFVGHARDALYDRLLAFVEVAAEEFPTRAGRLEFERLLVEQRAQTGGNLVGLVIGIAVAVIVGVGVSIPIVNDVIASANLSGLTATIVGFIPVMLGVLIFVATVGPIMQRT